ncbi:hypothetical protein [Algibacter lectus]|uniref:hypothetical protein n=1 Tax=Algibacter lectus TaxID=221126 RepID=UPI002494EFC4|nr:hypothetical protein [Algibacter lectus]
MNNNLINLTKEDLDRNIYRIYPLHRFLDLFKNNQNTLVKTSLWDDPFENFILNSTGKLPDGQLFDINSRNKYYGQCWSLQKESDAMWRIYSQHIKDKDENLIIDNIGIKVKSTIRNVFQDLFNTQESYINPYNKESYNTSTFIGKVQYKRKKKLIKILHDEISNFLLDQSGKGQASTLMLKRVAFTHEKEVRIVYYNENSMDSEKVFSYDISPNDCFEEIVVDPRIPKDEYLKIKDLIEKEGYQNKIIQSGLYKIENFTFKMDLP